MNDAVVFRFLNRKKRERKAAAVLDSEDGITIVSSSALRAERRVEALGDDNQTAEGKRAGPESLARKSQELGRRSLSPSVDADGSKKRKRTAINGKKG
jgi:hypothetical protein